MGIAEDRPADWLLPQQARRRVLMRAGGIADDDDDGGDDGFEPLQLVCGHVCVWVAGSHVMLCGGLCVVCVSVCVLFFGWRRGEDEKRDEEGVPFQL